MGGYQAMGGYQVMGGYEVMGGYQAMGGYQVMGGYQAMGNRISSWLTSTGAAIVSGAGSNVTVWSSQQVLVMFLNSLCGTSAGRVLLDDEQGREDLLRTFGVLANPVTVFCRRANTFLTTTGSTIMQGASSTPANLTSAQVLISVLRAACQITRGADSVSR
nr:uncharacterized protein LOC123772682 [Procambarus clarkii]